MEMWEKMLGVGARRGAARLGQDAVAAALLPSSAGTGHSHGEPPRAQGCSFCPSLPMPSEAEDGRERKIKRGLSEKPL